MSDAGERHEDWRPVASRAVLERRAAMLARVRAFFAARGVLEVETPLIVNAGVTDVHVHAARIELDGGRAYFLHTSPEYAMKRLLAAGSGDIFQVCHVVRGFERSRLHNPEFTLVEWYRLGFSLERLMTEVEALVRELLGPAAGKRPTERVTYREAFLRELALDPLAAQLEELEPRTRTLGYRPDAPIERSAERDLQLELLMGALIGPKLGRGSLTFVHRYPASQAALARLDPADPRVALRFELYSQGVELANGFEELASACEQRARFERDRTERRRRGLAVPDPDERLLAALEAGLPDCAGVALGFDRLVMLALGARHIDEVLAFPTPRA
ncbi:MAG TPA: EF-P lysine aminoacylase EpmA [Steroidobacteraceae bacterium]|nr:EF-P lysine aminoacylase EpmA [Steroidobacteraceae bacterium]